MRINRFAAFSVLALAGLAGRVFADGTTDIYLNPTATVTVSAPGSYRVVNSVIMTAAVTAITVSVDRVTIDLNGQTLDGNNVGVDGISAGSYGFELFGGKITRFTGTGVNTSSTLSRIHDLTIDTCANGIVLGNNAEVRDCSIAGKGPVGGTGISTGTRSSVERVNVSFQGTGISVGNGSRIANCTVNDITPSSGVANGLTTGTNCAVTGNVVRTVTSTNGAGTGISANTACHIADNVVETVSAASTGGSTGISSTGISVIRGNKVGSCTATGSGDAICIYSATGSVIEGNMTTSPQVTGAGTTASAIGIRTTGSSILNNVCTTATAGAGTNGSGVGISCGSQSRVVGNHCTSGIGVGTGFGIGILASGSNHIESNLLEASSGGAGSWGLRITNASNFVADNFVQGNVTAGIIYVLGMNNRSERNRMRQTTGIDLVNGVAPASAGTADLADVVY